MSFIYISVGCIFIPIFILGIFVTVGNKDLKSLEKNAKKLPPMWFITISKVFNIGFIVLLVANGYIWTAIFTMLTSVSDTMFRTILKQRINELKEGD